MPVYLYLCRKCKREIEELQKYDDPAPPLCPECGAKDSLERIIARSNFQLVGSGWASDGYG